MPDAPARLERAPRARRRRPSRPRGHAAELEELRVRYLGRKSELTAMLRSIGELPPEQRGPGRQGGQRGPAGARGAARERAAALEAAELDERLAATRST